MNPMPLLLALVALQTEADLAEPVEDSWVGPVLFVLLLIIAVVVVVRKNRR